MAEPSEKFTPHRKRGPKKKHTLDGIDRMYPAPKDYNNITAITAVKGRKNLKAAVRWSDSTNVTWEPVEVLLAVPRLRDLYSTHLASQQQNKNNSRKKVAKGKDGAADLQTQAVAAPVIPTSTEELPPLSIQGSSGEQPIDTRTVDVLQEQPLGSGDGDSQLRSITPANPTFGSDAFVAEANGTSVDPVSAHLEEGAHDILPEEQTPTTNKKRRKQPTTPTRSVVRTTEKRTLTLPSPSKEVKPSDPLLKKPYMLAASMIVEMRRNPNLQLVPTSLLSPYIEYDCSVTPKFG